MASYFFFSRSSAFSKSDDGMSKALRFMFFLYDASAGPVTIPPQRHESSEFAPSRFAPWYWYSTSPQA